ncbi:unnamed protein product [Blepharisma stoltei]|uniref:ATP synthase F0 subunit 8 n=1 Tax=Blepharisma stoltei TaxID=1481888 RepID=A0AAU9JMD0_9CILI|nr:unnamed protein product [Blepharisma stoltei]
MLWICCAIAKIDEFSALIVLILGWALLLVFGAIYQKLYLPSLLETEKGKSIYQLFRFQLLSINPEDAGIKKSAKYIFSANLSQSNSNRPGLNIPDDDALKSNGQLEEQSNSNVELYSEYNSSLCNCNSTQK